jgi:hypothetical protein
VANHAIGLMKERDLKAALNSFYHPPSQGFFLDLVGRPSSPASRVFAFGPLGDMVKNESTVV